MKPRNIIALVALLAGALIAGLGALSDPLVASVAEELQRRARTDRMFIDWFSGIGGIDAPEFRAYLRGRAEGAEQARELILRANQTGTISTDVIP
jgi:hypothetical protein